MEAEIHVLIDVGAKDSEVLNALAAAGFPSKGSREIEPSLEDVFVTLTRSLAKP
jgi:hypothetical protein